MSKPLHWYLSFNLESYILGNFLTLSPSCCDNAACFPCAGIFVSTDGCHLCESPCVSSTADPLSFFLSFLGPTLIPAALFSRSRSYIALLFLFRSPSFLPCCPWSRPRARAPGINRAAAPLVYACLRIQGAPSRRISPGNAVLFAHFL